MGARVSAKGVTKFGFGKTDPAKQTSSNKEAAALIDTDKGIHVPAPPTNGGGKGPGGHKVKGATRTKGGSI